MTRFACRRWREDGPWSRCESDDFAPAHVRIELDAGPPRALARAVARILALHCNAPGCGEALFFVVEKDAP